MTEAIYHEARGEMRAGQIAVADVILTRFLSKCFPNTVKDVVHEWRFNDKGKKVCQFSYHCDNIPDQIMSDFEAREEAEEIATLVLTDLNRSSIVDGSDHFFNPNKVSPSWEKRMRYIGEIGNHLFLRSDCPL